MNVEKKIKFLMLGRYGVASRLEVEISGREFFQVFGIFFTVDRGGQQDMDMRLKTFGAVKVIFKVRRVSLGLNSEV